MYTNDSSMEARYGAINAYKDFVITMYSGPAFYIRCGETTTDFPAPVVFGFNTYCENDFTVAGTKSRVSKTINYGNRLEYCYETPTPMFGDIGEGQTDDTGVCVIQIDDIFYETISQDIEYQVFLQKEGPGDIWVSEKTPTHFMVSGTNNLKFSWEIKAVQKGYDYTRLEDQWISTYEYREEIDYEDEADNYIQNLISEMEGIA
jgi:hypothetical protein